MFTLFPNYTVTAWTYDRIILDVDLPFLSKTNSIYSLQKLLTHNMPFTTLIAFVGSVNQDQIAKKHVAWSLITLSAQKQPWPYNHLANISWMKISTKFIQCFHG